MSNKLGQRCQMLLTVMYFTDLSRITLLSAAVENKFYQKEKIILFITEQKNKLHVIHKVTFVQNHILLFAILFTATVKEKNGNLNLKL